MSVTYSMPVCGCSSPAVVFFTLPFFLLSSGACTGLCHPLKNLPQSFEPSLVLFYPKRVRAMLVPHFFLFLWIFFLEFLQYPLAMQMPGLQACTIMKNNVLNSCSLSNYYIFMSKFVIFLLENSYFFLLFLTKFQKSCLQILVLLILLSP